MRLIEIGIKSTIMTVLISVAFVGKAQEAFRDAENHSNARENFKRFLHDHRGNFSKYESVRFGALRVDTSNNNRIGSGYILKGEACRDEAIMRSSPIPTSFHEMDIDDALAHAKSYEMVQPQFLIVNPQYWAELNEVSGGTYVPGSIRSQLDSHYVIFAKEPISSFPFRMNYIDFANNESVSFTELRSLVYEGREAIEVTGTYKGFSFVLIFDSYFGINLLSVLNARNANGEEERFATHQNYEFDSSNNLPRLVRTQRYVENPETQ